MSGLKHDTEQEPGWCDPIAYALHGFELSRRRFVQVLGAGLLIVVNGEFAFAQRRRGASGAQTVGARLHIGEDGVITVLSGKVEVGQGARTEIALAAAEELRIPADQIQVQMSDSDRTPDDGGTYGSRTTPSTIPDVRRGAAYARELLIGLAAQKLSVPKEELQADAGKITHAKSGKSVAYAELAKGDGLDAVLKEGIPRDIALTPVSEWKQLGKNTPRKGGRDIVTGAHQYPSDIIRPGMLYGKVLRPTTYKGKLKSIEKSAAQAMKDVVVVHDGEFVACAAPTSFLAAQALAALSKTAQWDDSPHPASKELSAYLRAHAGKAEPATDVADALGKAKHALNASYDIAYIQHVPMEPRAAIAEWNGDKLTVWTGTQNPDSVRGDLAKAFSLAAENIHLAVPDTGGGYGGKHSGECAVEAARLAKAAGKPVAVHWTREEEFTWAYFRPGGVIDLKGGLDADGKIVAWEHVNYNSGRNAAESPYRIAPKSDHFIPCDAPLRGGSYRGLAATANNFARESFMDDLAAQAGADPLAFRLAHLDDGRLKNVLNAAAKQFGWTPRKGPQNPASKTGVGLACGTEKGSFVAACVEIEVNRDAGTIKVKRVCQAFDCGPVLYPDNLRAQIEGGIIMALGGALFEEMIFENGKMLNGTLKEYRVPRLKDIPKIEITIVEPKEVESAGAGETPIIALAPAIANAVFDATGIRIRSMPIRGAAIKTA